MYYVCSFEDEVFVLPDLIIVRQENWENIVDNFEVSVFSEDWEIAFINFLIREENNSYFAKFFTETCLGSDSPESDSPESNIDCIYDSRFVFYYGPFFIEDREQQEPLPWKFI